MMPPPFVFRKASHRLEELRLTFVWLVFTFFLLIFFLFFFFSIKWAIWLDKSLCMSFYFSIRDQGFHSINYIAGLPPLPLYRVSPYPHQKLGGQWDSHAGENHSTNTSEWDQAHGASSCCYTESWSSWWDLGSLKQPYKSSVFQMRFQLPNNSEHTWTRE